MPFSRRLSKSERSFRQFQCKFQEEEGIIDGPNLEQDLANSNHSPSKSDPPKIYVEDNPLDVGLDGLPRIHPAVSEGNVELLKELIENGNEDVNMPDSEGWPPLHTAIKQGRLDCAAYLLKKGATEFYERQQREYQKRLGVSNGIAKYRANSYK